MDANVAAAIGEDLGACTSPYRSGVPLLLLNSTVGLFGVELELELEEDVVTLAFTFEARSVSEVEADRDGVAVGDVCDDETGDGSTEVLRSPDNFN